jgi:hypothetical protein
MSNILHFTDDIQEWIVPACANKFILRFLIPMPLSTSPCSAYNLLNLFAVVTATQRKISSLLFISPINSLLLEPRVILNS